MSSPAVQPRARVPRIAESAVERARLVVVPRRRTQAARMPFVMLVSLVLVGGVVGLLLFNTSMQQASFAASALEEQASTLNARQQTLQRELEDLRDPQRLAEQAVDMGMVPPSSPAFLTPDGKVLGEAAAAQRGNTVRLQARPPSKPAVLDPAPVVTTVVGQEAADEKADDKADRKRDQQARQQGEKNRPRDGSTRR